MSEYVSKCMTMLSKLSVLYKKHPTKVDEPASVILSPIFTELRKIRIDF